MIETSLLAKPSSVVLRGALPKSPKVVCGEVSTAVGKRMPRPSPWDKHGRHQAQHGDDQDDPRLSMNISIFPFKFYQG